MPQTSPAIRLARRGGIMLLATANEPPTPAQTTQDASEIEMPFTGRQPNESHKQQLFSPDRLLHGISATP
jgi:hypothetical protein